MLSDVFAVLRNLAHAKDWARYDKFVALTEKLLDRDDKALVALDKQVKDEMGVLAEASGKLPGPGLK